jgi:hypothetical protein
MNAHQLSAQADRLVLRRAWSALLLGALFLLTQLASLGDPPLGSHVALHFAAWLAWSAVLGGFLLWGSGLLGRRGLSALLNDEGGTAHRHRAQQLGFWCALLAAGLVYAASFYEVVAARDACRLIVTAAITPALLGFGWLELRSLREP